MIKFKKDGLLHHFLDIYGGTSNPEDSCELVKVFLKGIVLVVVLLCMGGLIGSLMLVDPLVLAYFKIFEGSLIPWMECPGLIAWGALIAFLTCFCTYVYYENNRYKIQANAAVQIVRSKFGKYCIPVRFE